MRECMCVCVFVVSLSAFLSVFCFVCLSVPISLLSPPAVPAAP